GSSAAALEHHTTSADAHLADSLPGRYTATCCRLAGTGWRGGGTFCPTLGTRRRKRSSRRRARRDQARRQTALSGKELPAVGKIISLPSLHRNPHGKRLKDALVGFPPMIGESLQAFFSFRAALSARICTDNARLNSDHSCTLAPGLFVSSTNRPLL